MSRTHSIRVHEVMAIHELSLRQINDEVEALRDTLNTMLDDIGNDEGTSRTELLLYQIARLLLVQADIKLVEQVHPIMVRRAEEDDLSIEVEDD